MSRIISIMTTYYPNKESVDNAKKISGQSDLLIICDNSPKNHKYLFSDLKNYKYFFWGENLGLSAAFNRVLKEKIFDWKDDDYIVFFDQDTTIPPRHVKKLIDEYNYLISIHENVGCIGPVYFNLSNNSEEIPKIKDYVDNKTMKVSCIITTSMLCQYKNIKKISFWNENVFLDMADWDICWRYNKAGMNSYLTAASIISHTVGENNKKIGPITIRVWKPFREYYQVRDGLYLFFKLYTPLKYKLKFVFMMLITLNIHFLCLDHGVERMKYTFKGIKDYFIGKKGSL